MNRRVLLVFAGSIAVGGCERRDVVGSQDSGANDVSVLADGATADSQVSDTAPDVLGAMGDASGTDATDATNSTPDAPDATHVTADDRLIGTWRTIQHFGDGTFGPYGYHADLVFDANGSVKMLQSSAYGPPSQGTLGGCLQNHRGYGSWTAANAGGALTLNESAYHETLERMDCVSSNDDLTETDVGPVPNASSEEYTIDGDTLTLPHVATSTNSLLTFTRVVLSPRDALVGTWRNTMPPSPPVAPRTGYYEDAIFGADGSVETIESWINTASATSLPGCTVSLRTSSMLTDVETTNGIDTFDTTPIQIVGERTGCTNASDNMIPTLPIQGETSSAIFSVYRDTLIFPRTWLTYIRR